MIILQTGRKRLIAAALSVSLSLGSLLCARAGDTFVYIQDSEAAEAESQAPANTPDKAASGRQEPGTETEKSTETEDPFVYSPDTVQAAVSATMVESGREFGFGSFPSGDASSASSFTNEWANYTVAIPQGAEADSGKPYYDKIYYTELDALGDLGMVYDLILVSSDTSEVKPDPEEISMDAMVLMTFFLSKGEEAPGRTIDAYAKKSMKTATGNGRLEPYIAVDRTEAGGFPYIRYTIDYGEAIQQLYHTLYLNRTEHPAFEESYCYRMEMYFREIDDKIMGIATLKSGKYYTSTTNWTDCFRKAHD